MKGTDPCWNSLRLGGLIWSCWRTLYRSDFVAAGPEDVLGKPRGRENGRHRRIRLGHSQVQRVAPLSHPGLHEERCEDPRSAGRLEQLAPQLPGLEIELSGDRVRDERVAPRREEAEGVVEAGVVVDDRDPVGGRRHLGHELVTAGELVAGIVGERRVVDGGRRRTSSGRRRSRPRGRRGHRRSARPPAATRRRRRGRGAADRRARPRLRLRCWVGDRWRSSGTHSCGTSPSSFPDRRTTGPSGWPRCRQGATRRPTASRRRGREASATRGSRPSANRWRTASRPRR